MLISNAVLALLRNPDQLALLKKDPALIGGAVEECLRYDSVILGFRAWHPGRQRARPVDPQGSADVSAFCGSANRDPDRFRTPTAWTLRAKTSGTYPLATASLLPGAPLASTVAQIGISTTGATILRVELAADTWNIAKTSTSRPAGPADQCSSVRRDRTKERDREKGPVIEEQS